MAEVDNGGSAAATAKRDRSPSFPYIGLTRAVERTGQLLAKAKRSEVRLADAASAWGTGPKSSATLQIAAALLAFGLVEDSGSGEARKIRVSDLGRRILEDTRPGVKDAALAEAASRPPLIVEMARHWEGDRPDDDICISELKFDRGFTDDGARAFLRVFDDTVRYTRVQEGDKSGEAQQGGMPDFFASLLGSGTGKGERTPKIKVGDHVQWTNNGIDQFATPAKVAWVSDDQTWLRVEGSSTGIPMNEVELQASLPPGGMSTPPPSAENDIKVLLDGDRLRITASVDLRGARKLMKVLKANMALLEDDEDEDESDVKDLGGSAQ